MVFVTLLESVQYDNMQVLIIYVLRLKMFIHSPKWGFRGIWSNPHMGSSINATPKDACVKTS